MTKESFVTTLFSELEKNGIDVESIHDESYRIRNGRNCLFISFYEMSFDIAVYSMVNEFEGYRLMALDFFYEDTEHVWVSGKSIFVRPATRSYCVFNLEG